MYSERVVKQVVPDSPRKFWSSRGRTYITGESSTIFPHNSHDLHPADQSSYYNGLFLHHYDTSTLSVAFDARAGRGSATRPSVFCDMSHPASSPPDLDRFKSEKTVGIHAEKRV